MSGPFGSLSVPASGMSTYKTWIDALSDNVANVNTVRSTSEAAFQERFVVAEAPRGHFGLRLVEDVVGEAGGTVQVDSTPGEGTTVRVEVPT